MTILTLVGVIVGDSDAIAVFADRTNQKWFARGAVKFTPGGR